MRVYMASPLGFSGDEFALAFRNAIKARLVALGHEPVDPWNGEPLEDGKAIFQANVDSVESCDAVLAFLNGMEPDSGTCWELGYAYKAGKPCYGLRTDWRSAGDFPGASINLQVFYGLVAMFTSVDAIDF